jgi:hypothetical protein
MDPSIYYPIHLNLIQLNGFDLLLNANWREKLLDNEKLNSRISEACSEVLFSDLKGFYRYLASDFDFVSINNL